MFDIIARVLAFFYGLPVVGGSYGLAIILLTASVMVLLMPLTLKATRSTIKMQEMQPRLKALQKEHKDDKQTLNAELMKLYQEHGINPVGGCLPMVAQLPVFLVLFRVLNGLSRRVSETPFYAIANNAREAVGLEAVPGDTFDPDYLSTASAMYTDLSQDTEMSFGPFDLAAEALDVLRSDIVAALPYIVLILFVVGTSFYQQRQVSSRRTGSIGMNPQQEMMLKFLPLLSGIWSFVFPAGLVLYWATSNVFRIGQQGYITRAFYSQKEAGLGDDVDTIVDVDAVEKEAKGETTDTADGTATNGSAKAAKPGPKKPKSAANASSSSSKGSHSSNGSDEAKTPGSNKDREQAWADRRREKAKVQAANKKPSEPSSRVTPKGTKPSGPKKKRKR